MRLLVAGVALAALAGCGGGGGGGGDGGPDGPTAVITAANADAVARAAVAGIMTLGAAGELPLDAGLAAGLDARALGAGGPAMRGWLPRVQQALSPPPWRRTVAAAGHRTAQAVIGPVTEPCAISGSLSITLDDRDNDDTLSVDDRMTLRFEACRDIDGETLDGEVSIQVVSISMSPLAVTADLTLASLSDATSTRSLTIHGMLRMDYSLPGGTGTLERTALTARGDVAIAVSTSLPFSDDVTLLDGWRVVQDYDATVAPVAGNVWEGRTTTSASGRIHSAAAGGSVDVTTPVLIVAYGEDPYPRTGVLRLDGQTGALRMTAASVDEVQIDLDANGDGTWESSRTEAWEDLL